MVTFILNNLSGNKDESKSHLRESFEVNELKNPLKLMFGNNFKNMKKEFERNKAKK
jgi:hypothetical protein